jgi:aerobic carbon-monoxide dehydrogenase small subunit
MSLSILLKVNGKSYKSEVEPRQLLAYHLRDGLRLTGTHIGCDTSSCGACTVLIDGKAVKSCNILAVQAEGCEITTVEGLSQNGELHPIQEGFREEHGLQCGFCTPGMMKKSAMPWRGTIVAVQVITILCELSNMPPTKWERR